MNVDTQMKNIAIKLKEARKTAGLTQLELSMRSGVSQNMITYIEQGKRGPALKTILKLCEALDISLADLLDAEDRQETDKSEIKERIIELVNLL